MRLARALALAGIASRRKSEELIRNGAIRVNGELVQDLGRQVDPENDAIFYRGKILKFQQPLYYLLHKPVGYMTTVSDPHAEKTVYDLLPRGLAKVTRQLSAGRTRVFPVGRLDKDSEGLLLFTNDGDLAYRLTHPRFEIPKWYEVRLNRAFEDSDQFRLIKGVRLEDGLAVVKSVRLLSRRKLLIEICEGRNREIRRIFEALNYKVIRLVRHALGPIKLGSLPLGAGRFLSKEEIKQLQHYIAEKIKKNSGS